MANEQIIDVTEETVEIMAEQSVTDVVKGIDWVKYGKVAGVITVGVAGVYVARKFAPKVATGIKTLWTNVTDNKKDKKLKNMTTVEVYEVDEVIEDENDK